MGGDHDNHSQQIVGANVLMRKVVENESKYLIVPWKATLLSVFFFFWTVCALCTSRPVKLQILLALL